jgi:hypothetical protein
VRPIVFYFSIEELEKVAPGGYNIPALEATFESLLEADQPPAASFELRQGDLLLYTLCYRPSRVELQPRKLGIATNPAGDIVTHTTGDTDLFQTLIWDLDDATCDGWRTIDSDTLFRSVGNRDVFALTLTALSTEIRDHVDQALRQKHFYLGGFEADPGNPIQRHISIETLVHAFDYRTGALLFDPWRSEEPFDPPPLDRHGDEWYLHLTFSEIRYMTDEERLDTDRVGRWSQQPASDRGARSARLLAARRDGGHLARLAEDIAMVPVDDDLAPFVVEVGAMPRAADALIEESKLTDYLLSATHTSGRHKARWFKAVLGIEAAEWRHLSAQLRQGLVEATEFRRLRGTDYGLQYEVETAVAGTDGKRAMVTSVWQIADGQAPRFITAHPGHIHDSDAATPTTLTLPPSLDGSERWSALLSLARAYADDVATAVTPTPMRISGGTSGEWIDEPYGFAWVTIENADRGFARWLARNDHAETEPRVGAVLRAPGSSFDRATAWADSFVEVLGFNGVKATYSSSLD